MFVLGRRQDGLSGFGVVIKKICLTMFYILKPFWKVLGPDGCPPRPRGLCLSFYFSDECLGGKKR